MKRTREERQKIIAGAVYLNALHDIPKLKRDLLTPYPKPEFANGVFLRALASINALELQLEELRDVNGSTGDGR